MKIMKLMWMCFIRYSKNSLKKIYSEQLAHSKFCKNLYQMHIYLICNHMNINLVPNKEHFHLVENGEHLLPYLSKIGSFSLHSYCSSTKIGSFSLHSYCNSTKWNDIGYSTWYLGPPILGEKGNLTKW